MTVIVHSRLTAGIAAAAATTLTLATAVSAPVLQARAEHVVAAAANPSREFAIRLMAALQHPTPPVASSSPAAATQLPATAPAPVAAAKPAASTVVNAAAFGLPGVANAIINTYNTVMPWVDWGVSVAQWAVGWVPWVGWVASDQIGIFYFDLIRPIITSAVYNTAFVIGGAIGLGPAIGNFFNDTGAAIRGFIQSEISWALSFLPPLPPLAAAKAAAAKAAGTTAASPVAAAATTTAVTSKIKSDRRSHTDSAVGEQTASDVITHPKKKSKGPSATDSPAATTAGSSADTSSDTSSDTRARHPKSSTKSHTGDARSAGTHSAGHANTNHHH